MNDFLSTFHDSEYQGCIGMEMAKRPYSGGAGTAKDTIQFKDKTMKFVEECNPTQVYTVHGSTKELAKQIQKQLGINAQPLPKYGQTSIEKYN